jgi:hypothetical protein
VIREATVPTLLVDTLPGIPLPVLDFAVFPLVADMTTWKVEDTLSRKNMVAAWIKTVKKKRMRAVL